MLLQLCLMFGQLLKDVKVLWIFTEIVHLFNFFNLVCFVILQQVDAHIQQFDQHMKKFNEELQLGMFVLA